MTVHFLRSGGRLQYLRGGGEGAGDIELHCLLLEDDG